jgi:hypothetical protein
LNCIELSEKIVESQVLEEIELKHDESIGVLSRPTSTTLMAEDAGPGLTLNVLMDDNSGRDARGSGDYICASRFVPGDREDSSMEPFIAEYEKLVVQQGRLLFSTGL